MPDAITVLEKAIDNTVSLDPVTLAPCSARSNDETDRRPGIADTKKNGNEICTDQNNNIPDTNNRPNEDETYKSGNT